eukprot:TRINITY_DN10958_c0_g1_i1.p1 TRINITY_DN10958_c0_g1~~TRINITY_DN10958_c0_g1_i1.p1  ORF type:complete len:390 (-),score=71.35 TRINITY_DN10958_c0_g1_i1:58-1227(-)
MKKTIIVIDGNPLHNWVELFDECILADGTELEIVQGSWMDVAVVVHETTCYVTIGPVHSSVGAVKPQTLTVVPDLVIIRNQPRGPTPVSDNRNALYGLLIARVPTMNSSQSIYMNLERPNMVGALRQVQSKLGKENFPLIPMSYYSTPSIMAVYDEWPCILKVSHAHAGMGKIKLNDHGVFRDVSTILSLNNDYCTAEKYIDTEYGVRIQKIGPSYRVYKKVHTGSGWKSQFGGSDLQEIDLTDQYKLWADECAKSFGGMDWLAIDIVHGHDGNDYIIELNGTAIGIVGDHWLNDSEIIVDLAIEKMNRLYCSEEVQHDYELQCESQWESVSIMNKSHRANIRHLEHANEQLRLQLEIKPDSSKCLIKGIGIGVGLAAILFATCLYFQQ